MARAGCKHGIRARFPENTRTRFDLNVKQMWWFISLSQRSRDEAKIPKGGTNLSYTGSLKYAWIIEKTQLKKGGKKL